MSNERKPHPMAGKAVEVMSGPLKGKFVVVIDYLVNQFQGKDIKKIAKAHPELVVGFEKRKLLDDKIVYAQLYPKRDFVSVHDKDIMIEKPKQEKGLKLVKGEEDDTGTTVGTDSIDNGTDSEPEGSEGRADSVPEEMESVASPFKPEPNSSGLDDGGVDGLSEEPAGSDKPKAGNGTGASGNKKKPRKPKASENK